MVGATDTVSGPLRLNRILTHRADSTAERVGWKDGDENAKYYER